MPPAREGTGHRFRPGPASPAGGLGQVDLGPPRPLGRLLGRRQGQDVGRRTPLDVVAGANTRRTSSASRVAAPRPPRWSPPPPDGLREDPLRKPTPGAAGCAPGGRRPRPVGVVEPQLAHVGHRPGARPRAGLHRRLRRHPEGVPVADVDGVLGRSTARPTRAAPNRPPRPPRRRPLIVTVTAGQPVSHDGATGTGPAAGAHRQPLPQQVFCDHDPLDLVGPLVDLGGLNGLFGQCFPVSHGAWLYGLPCRPVHRMTDRGRQL